MNRRSAKILIAAGLGTLLAVLSVTYRPHSKTQGVGPLSPEVKKALRATNVPSFVLENATAEEAIQKIGTLIEANTQPSVHLLRWKSPVPPPRFHREIPKPPSEIPGLTPTPSDKAPTVGQEEQRISLTLLDLPLGDLLRYVENLYDGSVGQRGNELYFVSGRGTFDELIDYEFPIQPVGGMSDLEFTNWARNEMTMYEGSDVWLDAKRHLRVRNTLESIDSLDGTSSEGLGGAPHLGPLHAFEYSVAKCWYLLEEKSLKLRSSVGKSSK